MPLQSLLDLLERRNLRFTGFEKEDEDEEDEEDESEEEDEDEEDDDDEDEEGEKGKKKPAETKSKRQKEEEERQAAEEKLRGALKKERVARRQADREKRTLQQELDRLKAKPGGNKKPPAKKEEETEDDSESKALREQSERDRQRSEKLAAKLAANALETTIIRALGDPKLGFKFADPEDVIRLIDREDIDIDQDPDEPDKVTVDTDDVKRAVKALAKKKPHLLVKDEKSEEGEGSGKTAGKFGGRKKGDKTTEMAELARKYPALDRR